MRERASDSHLYFSWTSALHRLTRPVWKLRTRILPFRALEEETEREKEGERRKRSAIFHFCKTNPCQTAAFSWSSDATRSDVGRGLPGEDFHGSEQSSKGRRNNVELNLSTS